MMYLPRRAAVVRRARRHHLDVVDLSCWRSCPPNSSNVTSPSSLSRPRRIGAPALSLISLAMKCGKPPFWAWLMSPLDLDPLGLTAVPPIVLTRVPAGDRHHLAFTQQ